MRKGNINGGNAAEKGLKLLGLRVESEKLAVRGKPRCEDSLSVLARNWPFPIDSARCQLNGLLHWLQEHASPLIECPKLVLGLNRWPGLKYEERPVGSPPAAALDLRDVPTGKHLMKTRTARRNLPKPVPFGPGKS